MALFSGSKLKVKRADQHILELQAVIGSFLKTDFYRLFIEVDPNDGSNLVRFEATKDMPWEVPLIIGDIVHNLRSALDLMTCEIVTMAGKEVDWTINFLIRDDRDKLVAAINDRKIKAAPKPIIDLIIDTIKPYKGGNDELCAINDIDIMDKHKLIIPVTSVTSLIGVSIEDNRHNTFTDMTFAVGPGGKLNAIKTNSVMKITNQGTPAFAVVFGKGQPLEGKAVFPTLHQLSQLVSGILQIIEEAYLTLSSGSL
jgi:hypothetical protein